MSSDAGVQAQAQAGTLQESLHESLQAQLLDALLDGRFEEFRRLLQHPAVDPAHKYGKPHFGSCLEVACRHRGRHDFVRELLKRVRPSVNHVVPEPLHHAAARGNVEAVELLLKDKRIKVNAEDSAGRTALHHAVRDYPGQPGEEAERFERCVQLLLAHPGADADRPNHKGFSALHEAATRAGGDGAEGEGGRAALRAILAHARAPLDLDARRAAGRSVRETIAARCPDLLPELPAPPPAAPHA